ncbi:antibiotic biosynthesis monooxygenase [Streptomyces abyssalis]|uniref:Antibiotic biosynthesis monooxygenase n=1 Tax=Streptomyces abyssalis TaxID=933944 RepID=A0A1E7JJN1_9ACTN|nr:antibiotic biosynthesis monooxygenase [Streptomyces abyssalis]OEU87325.1 antibiotic biosynthesis monooxygenase [Streptomyces abyssalis]OEU87856.1 antibiotic biosynthesis monooxygenase [Streptomyces abyssalis]
MTATDEGAAPRRQESVTVVFTWEVTPGKEAEFERWAHGIETAAAASPGQRSVTWLRPEGESRRYHAVVRFADTASLQRWMDSPERAAWEERVKGLGRSVRPQQATTGLETWFDVPRLVAKPPARWKMSLTTILGVYPFALLYDAVFAEYFVEWPLPARTAVFPLFLAPLLTYAVMPWLSRVLRRWLYPES